jgi:glycerol kinase
VEYILAIDQGTTGSRAIVYDKDGRQVAGAYQEFTQHFPQPGWVEHDPEEIWASVRAPLEAVLRDVPPGSIAGIGITNQRETVVVWDRETGEPVHNAIVWQCRRTAGRCDELRATAGETELFRDRTGLPIDAYFSATKIEWILRNVPGAREKAREGRLLCGTTDSWVLWKLTGGRVHATDYTNASRTMLFNISTLAWDEEILARFGIPREMLPEVKPSSGIVGETVRIGDLPSGVPIAGIAGDQQAALFGQACFEPGTVKNTYGTGSFVLLNVGAKKPVSEHGLIVTIACGPRGEPVYALEGAVFISGAAIQWLRDGLKLLSSASESERMAASVPDNAGVYFVPAFVGLGAPYWDQDARGSIFGLTRGTTAAHLVRAALEAMCYQTRDVLDAMRKDSGLEIGRLKVDGGAVANSFLCQFQSDILGIEVVRPSVIETTSLGAAYLAGLALGYWKDAEDIRACWHEDRVFAPRISRPQADLLYNGWQAAVRRTLTDCTNN